MTCKMLDIFLCQRMKSNCFRCNAKFLWKRIPADVKSANPELARIWAVGQSMWKKDFPGIYKALNENSWSEDISDIMKNVQGANLIYVW